MKTLELVRKLPVPIKKTLAFLIICFWLAPWYLIAWILSALFCFSILMCCGINDAKRAWRDTR